MSREVNRVPMDFSWPLKKVWEGFLMPEELHTKPCTACDQTGLSPEAKMLRDQWYGYIPFAPEMRGSKPLTPQHPKVVDFAIRNVDRAPDYYGKGGMAILREANRLCDLWNAQWSHHLNQDDVDALVEEGRLHDLTSRWDKDERRWIPTGHHPTAQEVNDWSIGGWGHDSINQWIVCRAEVKRLGYQEHCDKCHGKGVLYRDEAHRKAVDDWAPMILPKGDGWQMWETTSEGSPISPVFDTPEKLAFWLADNGASSFGSDTSTYDQWLNMIKGAGWAPSAIGVGDVVVSGVEGLNHG